MKQKTDWVPGPDVRVLGTERLAAHWVVEAESQGLAVCPLCGAQSTSRHSSYVRHLQDPPVQGHPVMVGLRSGHWRCRNRSCSRRIFTERTRRVVETHLVGHNAGGRPGERLMARFGMPLSDDTILRHLKVGAKTDIPGAAVRVVGVDDWAWRKGQGYGTIFVDLETRTVTDVLPDRSASSAAEWLTAHPGIEIVCRDRCGLYAEAARHGAPKARHVADRFHLLQNLREAIEKQLSNIGRPIRATASDKLATPGINSKG